VTDRRRVIEASLWTDIDCGLTSRDGGPQVDDRSKWPPASVSGNQLEQVAARRATQLRGDRRCLPTI